MKTSLLTPLLRTAAGLMLAATPLLASGQNALQRAGHNVGYRAEAQLTAGSDQSPLWLNANRHGLSSVAGNNGYVRAGLFRPVEADSAHRWRIGYGADVAVAYDFTSTFVVQQLYADVQWRWLRLTVGSKEQPMALRHQELSSGSQTLGINARPVPQVRLGLPEYVSITGPSNWAAIRGHVAYGLLTDSRWKKGYVGPTERYDEHTRYHSKAGYLRLGNAERFPLVFEGGVEMASTFGGTIRRLQGTGDLQMPHGAGQYWDVLIGKGGDATDAGYAGATGNTLGSWLFSLAWRQKQWGVRAYYDHFFEDHSMMFFEYGWRDGLYGLELTLPRNPVATTIVYEHLRTKYQSGPIYHDATEAVPDQISAMDDYYNHGLYAGWQHWGQAIGNPLFTSPLYDADGRLTFRSNRFVAHHVGISGDPLRGLHYRLLFSHTKSWGTYREPSAEVERGSSFLLEARYDFSHVPSLRGWEVGAALGLDRGDLRGKNTGLQLTVRRSGLLLR